MKRVAVFGNAGGGKSTQSKRLAETTGLPLIVLDLVQYRAGGEKVSNAEYKTVHDKILQKDCWIIDGFGSLDTVWKRLEIADTLPAFLTQKAIAEFGKLTRSGFEPGIDSVTKNDSLLERVPASIRIN